MINKWGKLISIFSLWVAPIGLIMFLCTGNIFYLLGGVGITLFIMLIMATLFVINY